jgi:hypothetical protein
VLIFEARNLTALFTRDADLGVFDKEFVLAS